MTRPINHSVIDLMIDRLEERLMIETLARKTLWWPTSIINSVDKTELPCNTPTDAAPSTTVSLEACPLSLNERSQFFFSGALSLEDEKFTLLFHLLKPKVGFN